MGLAGYALDRGATRRYGAVTPQGRAKADDVAASVRERFAVKTIGRATLDQWRSEAASRTLYVFDVRDAAEYDAGHMLGTVSAPGGQLVQGTDNWMGTRGARVVLVDDTGVRAAMTAHWLTQMRWDVHVLDDAGDASETEAPKALISGLEDVETIEPAALAAAIEAGTATALDVGISLDYRRARLPGALWSNRARIPQIAGSLPAGQKIVLYSEHDTRARLAARDLRAAIDAPVAVLRGGREAWVAAGLPTEPSPDLPADADCIDYLFWVHDRHHGNQDSMRAYLAWEEQLPAQIEADGDARFQII